MRAGFVCLIFGYVFSQFYRTFLAVLAPSLERELGLDKQDLASASGWWFLAFGALQLPVGLALDRLGPRRTTSALFVLAALGALIFANAQSALALKIAMVLIGFGCAPILIASYFILGREFSPARFGLLASVTIGLGSLGDMAASWPFSMAATAFGWRPVMVAMAALTVAMAALIFALVRDPQRLPNQPGDSVFALLNIRALWPILALMVVCYAPPAALRGLWLGPYFHDMHHFTTTQIGQAGFAMGFALVAGSLIIGPLAKRIGSLKRTAMFGNIGMAIGLGTLWLATSADWPLALAGFLIVGLFGVSFPIITAHARLFLPAQLMGRGVALVNLFGIAAVGLAQQITGPLFTSRAAQADAAAGYASVFAFFALSTLIGVSIYHFAKETPAKSH